MSVKKVDEYCTTLELNVPYFNYTCMPADKGKVLKIILLSILRLENCYIFTIYILYINKIIQYFVKQHLYSNEISDAALTHRRIC